MFIPGLMRPEWFRRFVKTVDFYFYVCPGGIDEWPTGMHESLTIGIYLPLLRYPPWDWKRVPFLVPLGITLSAMFKTDHAQAGNILREFWQASEWITNMPERLVRDLLQNASWRRFLNISNDQRGRGGHDGAR